MNNLFKPTHLKQLCDEYHLSPSKKYGQNYLISESVIEKIVGAAELTRDDTVVEVGPGFGVLTFALAEKAKKVIAFEIEKKLQPYWERQKPDNVEMVWGNVLSRIMYHVSRIPNSYKLVANVPYQITSNFLRVVLETEHRPELIVVMVQREVAERICAGPGEMSLLAVSVQYFGEPSIVAKVPKGNFWPEPKVDSSILKVESMKYKVKSEETKRFFQIARAGFANKRKQVWRNLSEGLKLDKDKVKKVLTDVLGNDKVRAQELSVEDWKRVAHLLESA